MGGRGAIHLGMGTVGAPDWTDDMTNGSANDGISRRKNYAVSSVYREAHVSQSFPLADRECIFWKLGCILL